MRHIAILTCLEACRVCTGTACLEAWNKRERQFSRYVGAEAQLNAFLHCNGCHSDPMSDPGIAEKLQRLTAMGVDTVHLGVCTVKRETGTLCPTMKTLAELLQRSGMQIVMGTH